MLLQVNQGEQNSISVFGMVKSLIVRAALIYFISMLFRRGSQTPTSPNGEPSAPMFAATNVFSNGTIFDLHVYLSEKENFRDFNDSNAMIWSEYGLIYGDWYSGHQGDGSRTITHKFKPSQRLLNNGSIYLHVYVTKNGRSPDPTVKNSAKMDMAYRKVMFNKFKKIKYQKTHNLLTGETKATEEELKVVFFFKNIDQPFNQTSK